MAPSDSDLNELFADKAGQLDDPAYTHEEIFGEILESLGGSAANAGRLGEAPAVRGVPIRVKLPDPEPPSADPKTPPQGVVVQPPPKSTPAALVPEPKAAARPAASSTVDAVDAILAAMRTEPPKPIERPKTTDVDVEALLGLGKRTAPNAAPQQQEAAPLPPRVEPLEIAAPTVGPPPLDPSPVAVDATAAAVSPEPAYVPEPPETPQELGPLHVDAPESIEGAAEESTADTLPPTLGVTEPLVEMGLDDEIERLGADAIEAEPRDDELSSLLDSDAAAAVGAVADEAAVRFQSAPARPDERPASVLDLAEVAEYAIDSKAPPEPPKNAPLAGAFGPFELVERVAVGGMAEVYRARRGGLEGFEKTLAVKRILPHLATNPEFVEMFVNEAKMVSRLAHPNIVTITELGKIEGNYYIAMEYVMGRDLRAIMERANALGRSIPIDLAILMVRKVCSALDYAHRARDDGGEPMEIVHSDISPQNILISNGGDVKLTDFGIAKAANHMTPGERGVLRGKLYYMSPEQAAGGPVDHRSDLFSLGVVLYELATGARPFAGSGEESVLEAVRRAAPTPPHVANARVSERLSEAILRALEKLPEHRFQDASEMARALERCVGERGPDAPELARFIELLFDDAAPVETGHDEPASALVSGTTAPGPVITKAASEADADEIDFSVTPAPQAPPADLASPAGAEEKKHLDADSGAPPSDAGAGRQDISLPSLENVEGDTQPSSFKRMLKKIFG